MRKGRFICLPWMAVCLATAATPAWAVWTVEQATKLSQSTGRPVLAVAGSKT